MRKKQLLAKVNHMEKSLGKLRSLILNNPCEKYILFHAYDGERDYSARAYAYDVLSLGDDQDSGTQINAFTYYNVVNGDSDFNSEFEFNHLKAQDVFMQYRNQIYPLRLMSISQFIKMVDKHGWIKEHDNDEE